VSIEDVPIRAVDILAVIVSQKLKKQLSEVPLSKSIKELSNGKSTLQNEIMGDLQGEFSSAPDKGEKVWVPNVPMPCYSLLPLWSPPNALSSMSSRISRLTFTLAT
jgi:3-oxoacyl-ACP reductase-like protein